MKELKQLTLDDITSVRNLWETLDFEDSNKIEDNQIKISKWRTNNDEKNIDLFQLIDWFTFGFDLKNNIILPKELSPSSKELYDYFQDEHFTLDILDDRKESYTLEEVEKLMCISYFEGIKVGKEKIPDEFINKGQNHPEYGGLDDLYWYSEKWLDIKEHAFKINLNQM